MGLTSMGMAYMHMACTHLHGHLVAWVYGCTWVHMGMQNTSMGATSEDGTGPNYTKNMYLVSLTIWSYILLYIYTNNIVLKKLSRSC